MDGRFALPILVEPYSEPKTLFNKESLYMPSEPYYRLVGITLNKNKGQSVRRCFSLYMEIFCLVSLGKLTN